MSGWSFGVDVHERVAAAGYATDLLVTEELADLVVADPSTWGKAPGSGEVDVESLLAALGDATLAAVADRRTARRRDGRGEQARRPEVHAADR